MKVLIKLGHNNAMEPPNLSIECKQRRNLNRQGCDVILHPKCLKYTHSLYISRILVSSQPVKQKQLVALCDCVKVTHVLVGMMHLRDSGHGIPIWIKTQMPAVMVGKQLTRFHYQLEVSAVWGANEMERILPRKRRSAI